MHWHAGRFIFSLLTCESLCLAMHNAQCLNAKPRTWSRRNRVNWRWRISGMEVAAVLDSDWIVTVILISHPSCFASKLRKIWCDWSSCLATFPHPPHVPLMYFMNVPIHYGLAPFKYWLTVGCLSKMQRDPLGVWISGSQ